MNKEQIMQQIAIKKLEERAKEYQGSLYKFLLYYREKEKKIKLDENWHIELICKELEDVYYGKTKRLLINVPPRSLKTEIVSRIFPARCLGKKQGIKFMGISYSSGLAQDNSGDCRAIYQSDTYLSVFPRRLELKDDQNTKQHRENKAGGQYYASGSTGTITGKGCDCLTGDTIISTNKGYIRLDELVKLQDCNIAVNSYNGTTEEYKSVLAYRIIPNATIYEITLSTGDKLRTTGNHRIFVLGQGYKETQDLKEGDLVIREMKEVHKLLKGEVMKMTTLQSMLLQVKKSISNSKMLKLLKGLGETISGCQKGNKEMTNGYVLRPHLFVSNIYEKVLKPMYMMLMSKSIKAQEVLQGGMQSEYKRSKEESNRMSILLSKFKTKIIHYKVLFDEMQEQSSFTNYVMSMKLKLQTLTRTRQLSEGVLQDEKGYTGKGLKSMCNMLSPGESSYTSQRQKPKEQYGEQSSDCMQKTPCDTPLKQSITISSIKCLDHKETVYDIQVEGNENFFANGILVHNCMLIDDPLKPDDADSDTVRIGVNNNYHNTLYSRLNSKQDGAIVIIMQRIHDDDLCGHLIELEDKGGEKRKKVVIKAIAEEKEEHREKGESFFTKRFPIEILDGLRKQDPQTFSSQYQQEPTNRETQEFHEEWFRYHGTQARPTPPYMRIFTAVDPAFKTGQQNDQTSIITAGFIEDKCYILEITAGRITADVMQEKILYHIRKRQPEKIGIEAFQAQSMIITFLKAEMQRRGIYADIEEITQTGDKLSKIRKLVSLYKNGLIYHTLQGCEELEHELKRFPRGKHDDIVDSLQMLYNMYELVPNTGAKKQSFNIEYDYNGNVIYN